MKRTPRQKKAEAIVAQKMRADSNVVHIGIGFKYVNGEPTEELAVIVGVKKKVPISAAEVPVPERENGVRTDVIEFGTFEAYNRGPVVEATAQGKTGKRRPIPGGYSIGHLDITAGTLGAWVRLPGDPGYVALTNNHVGADTNKAFIGDAVIQPGPHDGGIYPRDAALTLLEFALIHMGDTPPPEPPPPEPPPPEPPPNGGKKWLSRKAWRAWLAVPNVAARLIGCDFRAVVVNMPKLRADFQARNRGAGRIVPLAISQPWPNLIDAAICSPIDFDIVPDPPIIDGIGELAGIRDLELGDAVAKTGRTTGFASGRVESIGSAFVSYREDGTAQFADQLIIRGSVGDFSAGGDSGSAIIDENNYLGGLLFAGGGGVTIANRISHVVAILGVTI